MCLEGSLTRAFLALEYPLSVPVIGQSELLDPKRGAHTLVLSTHENSSDDPADHDPAVAAWEMQACRMIGSLLHHHYQGHDWAIKVDRRGGIARIWINCLMSPLFAYTIKLRDLQQSEVINAGGQLLERFGIPRSTIDFSLVKQIRLDRGPLGDRLPPPGGMGR